MKRIEKELHSFIPYLERCKNNLFRKQFSLRVCFKFFKNGQPYSNTVFASSVSEIDYVISLYYLYFKISQIMVIDLDYFSSIRKSYSYV